MSWEIAVFSSFIAKDINLFDITLYNIDKLISRVLKESPMRFIWLILCYLLIIAQPYAATMPAIDSINNELRLAETNKNIPNRQDVIASYQKTLRWINEYDRTLSIANDYQNTINTYQKSLSELKNKLALSKALSVKVDDALSVSQIEQQIIQTNSRLLELSHAIQQEQEKLREINESLIQLPIQQSQANRSLASAEQLLQTLDDDPVTDLAKAKLTETQAEVNYYKAYINELALKQLSAPNRQTIQQLQIDILKSEYDKTEDLLAALRNKSNELRLEKQRETEQLAKELTTLDESFPQAVKEQIKENQILAEEFSDQLARRDQIAGEQRQISANIQSVRNVLNTLREQAQWLNMSTTLGEIQRAQLARLPKAPKPQQLDSEMAEQRALQLSLQDSLQKLDTFEQHFSTFKSSLLSFEQLKISLKLRSEDDWLKLPAEQLNQLIAKQHELIAQQNELLTTLSDKAELPALLFNQEQVNLFEQQINSRRDLLNSLLTGSETLIVELAQLKVLNSQLSDALVEVNEAAHRYLFWAADVNPINLSYPINLISDINQLISLNTFAELVGAFKMMLTTPDSLGFIFAAVLLVVFGISSRKHYNAFLERAASKVGRVTQDHFSLTLRTVFWSIIAALPLPILWGALSYGLQQAWPYPIAVALGQGVNTTVPIMWAFMISASFAHPKGLFITHLGWSAARVSRSMRYYKLTVWVVVPILIALSSFDTYNDREFASTIGRLCFFLLCAALVLMASNLRRAGVPLYLDSKGSGDNILNDTLWVLLRYAPVVAALAAAFGYFATSQALLLRLETSVVIWFVLLIIYYVIRRWMLIQRRRIEFERAKQRRAERLAQRARSEEEQHVLNSQDNQQDIEEPVVDLDTISSQSLALVRSILTMIALVSVVALWSEIHSAFSFLENIHLWDVTTTVQGVESNQPITLGALLIAIIVFIITAQLVRNMPALLELAILQHLELTPGSGFAITTITKYILMFIGCTVAFSFMGVEWSKLQWLIAALGVGLGFGLQEIFANFVSGLFILFEKPIRIGDMVTIRDLTGTITKINTRATTILDWDRKEIIMPNKAFITEQFVNWSLSDSITRIVTTVPAEIDADPGLVTDILKEAAEKCSLVLETPAPEAFLIDIHQGIQIFELRVFAGEMSNRMPLRHELHQLIMLGYQKHGLKLPFPPFQMGANAIQRSSVGNPLFKSGGI